MEELEGGARLEWGMGVKNGKMYSRSGRLGCGNGARRSVFVEQCWEIVDLVVTTLGIEYVTLVNRSRSHSTVSTCLWQ